jgi:hypothetical protein
MSVVLTSRPPRRRLAEVGLDHPRVRADVLRQALGDLLAVVEHRHALRDAHHDLHVVLDQEDRQVLLVSQAPDQRREVPRLVRVHACRGLVEQEQPRSERERAGHLEPPLVAVGQVARQLAGASPEPHVLEQVEALVARLALLALQAGVFSTVRSTPPRRWLCMATSTFSSAVMFWNRRMFWKVRAMPAWAILCGSRPVIDLPSNRTVPDVGLYMPVRMLKNVVLPAPFGPISDTIERSGW